MWCIYFTYVKLYKLKKNPMHMHLLKTIWERGEIQFLRPIPSTVHS